LLAAAVVVVVLEVVEAELVVLLTAHLNLYLLLIMQLLLAVEAELVEVFLDKELMGQMEQTQLLQASLMLLVVVEVDLVVALQTMAHLVVQGAAAEVGMVEFDAVEVLEL
jgi:hypothetical protein